MRLGMRFGQFGNRPPTGFAFIQVSKRQETEKRLKRCFALKSMMQIRHQLCRVRWGFLYQDLLRERKMFQGEI